MVDLSRALRTAAKTGNVEYGLKETTEAVEGETARAVVLSRNLPEAARADLLASAEDNQVPIVEFQGTNVELGPALGQPFAVSSCAILDPGESEILQAAKH